MTWAYKLAYRDKGIALSTTALKELQTSKRVFKVLCFKKTFEVLEFFDVKINL